LSDIEDFGEPGSQISLILKTFSHVTSELQKKAVEKMDELLKGAGT